MLIKELGICDYQKTWDAMRELTRRRCADTPDELWVLQHEAVYTQGLAGRDEYILQSLSYPLLRSDRGGQITFHAPGQAIVYCLIDLKRAEIGIRQIVNILEESVIALLEEEGIASVARRDAPGVYVAGRKIASLGLKVSRGCSYHGVALNVSMDLSPFQAIEPCGLHGMIMTRTLDCGSDMSVEQAGRRLAAKISAAVEQQSVSHL